MGAIGLLYIFWSALFGDKDAKEEAMPNMQIMKPQAVRSIPRASAGPSSVNLGQVDYSDDNRPYGHHQEPSHQPRPFASARPGMPLTNMAMIMNSPKANPNRTGNSCSNGIPPPIGVSEIKGF